MPEPNPPGHPHENPARFQFHLPSRDGVATLKTEYHESIRTALAQNVFVARSRWKLSQAELAQRAGISRATLAQIEAGQGDNVGLRIVSALAAVFGVSLSVLLITPVDLVMLAELVSSGHADLEGLRSEVETEDVARVQTLAGGTKQDRAEAGRIGSLAVESKLRGSLRPEDGWGVTVAAVASALGTAGQSVPGALLGAAVSIAAKRALIKLQDRASDRWRVVIASGGSKPDSVARVAVLVSGGAQGETDLAEALMQGSVTLTRDFRSDEATAAVAALTSAGAVAMRQSGA